MARSRNRRSPFDPERRVDLHGLSEAAALRRLAQELHAARVRGAQRVLVITGRGWGSDSQGGAVLAPAVRAWLQGPEGARAGVQRARQDPAGGAYEVHLGG